jgi:hypothetical protein
MSRVCCVACGWQIYHLGRCADSSQVSKTAPSSFSRGAGCAVRGLCPQAAIAQLEPSALSAAWDAALATIYKTTPWLETPRLGLAFAAGLGNLEAEVLAAELDCRIGLSSGRGAAWLAAIASSRAKARLEPDELGFLARVPVYLLRGIGVGEETLQRLELQRINS